MKNISLFIFLVLVLVNCSATRQENPSQTNQNLNTKVVPTIEEMIGQMIIVGIDGTTLNQNKTLKKYLAENKIGGIILYEKNIAKTQSKETLQNLCSDLQMISPSKLFIGIDQEGGKVNRLKTKYGFPQSVTATYLGELNNIDSTKFYAKQMAQTLHEIGINVNFAPDVDLCSNPNNPIIAKPKRCFSDNPKLVAKHAEVFVDAFKQHKILPVLKHFPGHGSSHADTHLDMADVTAYWTTAEIIPYQILIEKQKAPAIMSAHIINAKLDLDSLPATLSKSIITHLLRDSMNYNGVIFSDDMQMKAISAYFGLEKAIELAVNAGVDVLMFSGNIPGTQTPTIETVHLTFKKLLAQEKITESQIAAAYSRITQLKNNWYD